MSELLQDAANALITFLIYLGAGIVTFIVLYYLFARVLTWIMWQFIEYRARVRRERLGPQRVRTLKNLVASLMSGMSVFLTLLFLLGQIIPTGTLATTVGLFSAGIGFAARPYLSDVLGGLVLLFEDQFALGEKVEIGDKNVIGVVERVSVRTTHIRGELGEMYIVPNGDVRTIRNFTRGSFSSANIRLTVPTRYLDEAIVILQQIAAAPGPNVIETPEIISEQGTIGETTELMLKVKARYGHGPAVRRDLLTRLQPELAQHGIIADTHAEEKDGRP